MDQAIREETAVDLHHRVLLGLVKAIEAQLGPGGDRAGSASTLSKLLDFTRLHFEAEELVMGLHAYPQAEEHAEAHRRLLAEAGDLRRAHGRGDGPEARRTVERLRGWLLDHVRGPDRAFSGWCDENGIRPD
jgi:hemerythrin